MSNDWCPENDGAYHAEMAAMYPVANRKRIEKLEAKLAKAVESLRVIEDASRLYARDRESAIENVRYAHECTRRLCVTTLAELKGQNDG